jgi:hypothetical protein
MALWTLGEQQLIRPISNNNLLKFAQLQKEVEANDVVKYLGFEFYQELKRNLSTYTTLLNGGSYTEKGYTYTFSGLKYVLANLLYARYVRESSYEDTFSGLVRHAADGVERISIAELRNQEDNYKEIAGTHWDECLKYLCTLDLVWFPQQQKINKKLGWL